MSLEISSDLKDNDAIASLASPDVSSKDEASLKSEGKVIEKESSSDDLNAPISPPVPSPTIEENDTTNGSVDNMDVDVEKETEEVSATSVVEADAQPEQEAASSAPVEEENAKQAAEQESLEESSKPAETTEPSETVKAEATTETESKESQPEEVRRLAEDDKADTASLSPNTSSSEKHDRPNDDAEPNGTAKKLKTESGDAVVAETTAAATTVPAEANASGATPATATSNAAAAASAIEHPDYSLLDPVEPAEAMPKHQNKFALSVVRLVKRLKDAQPFVQPVDPVKLNIPTYYDYVKEPMDLGTMEKKLTANEYPTVVSFVHDLDLIISNCILFNGAESFISNMARNLSTSFHKHMTNMPKYDAQSSVSGKPKKKSSILPGSSPLGTPKLQRAAAVAANAANATGGALVKDELDVSGTPKGATPNRRGSVADAKPFALQPSGVPLIRRESAAEGGRPKREIHPPKSKDLPYGDVKPRRKKFAAELKFCGQVLKELFSKKHEAYSFPFLQPVDPVALNCPSYFKIIKEPMDLGTVQDRYNKNAYENADEFERDVRLIFKNCYKFNPEGSPVNVMGHKLEAVFDKKWQEKPLPAPSPPPILDSSDEEYSDYEEEINESRITNPTIQLLEVQLEQIKSQIATLRKEAVREAREARRNSIAAKKRRKSAKGVDGRRKSTTGGRRSSGSGLIAPVHITYEMKKELSEKIGLLPEKKLRHVVGIIEESMPQLKNSPQDEIELDMDQLDPETLMRLYNLVVKREERKAKAPKAPNSSRKKKNRPLSEAEQSRQLEELQKKIKQFDRIKDGSSEADSSSEDEDAPGSHTNNLSSDDSSSEEE
ncbi:chromatin-binding protein BDF1 [Sugiyamaella lignohabitans]|uniref:Chromatin-binding protein BDF1 n=1 Tax=Sugiyamaella lignohabitans TaxID=796027 RepID=A0A167DP52_9ASCO|nr:chromatin-binding protein BDF1 [Sugiyamaella lignohabitans]ANB13125.1 chromatin-binding protein BDF1 [Sugiyamaella lignohabitans]